MTTPLEIHLRTYGWYQSFYFSTKLMLITRFFKLLTTPLKRPLMVPTLGWSLSRGGYSITPNMFVSSQAPFAESRSPVSLYNTASVLMFVDTKKCTWQPYCILLPDG